MDSGSSRGKLNLAREPATCYNCKRKPRISLLQERIYIRKSKPQHVDIDAYVAIDHDHAYDRHLRGAKERTCYKRKLNPESGQPFRHHRQPATLALSKTDDGKNNANGVI